MLTALFLLPLLAAIAALALNRVLTTRWLAIINAAALIGVAVLLLLGARSGNLGQISLPWLTLDTQTISVTLSYDAATLPLAVFVAGGGALALLALGLALPAQLREYGGLVASVMLLLEITLLGLAVTETLLVPLAWAASTLLAFVALRASGGPTSTQTVPIGLLANLLGAILLLGGTLNAQMDGTATEVSAIALASLLIAALLALGAPPLHRTIKDVAAAPASVAAPLLVFGVPLLGAYALLRFAAQNVIPDGWRTALQILGAFTLLVSASGALGERRLQQIIGWLMSAQLGLFMISLGLNQAAVATIGPALLQNAAITTLAALLCVAILERRTGTDDLDAIRLDTPMILPGLAIVFASASALGLPGTGGFWPMLWLYNSLHTSSPLLIGPILAGSALCALAWFAPITSFFRARQVANQPSPSHAFWPMLPPILAVVPLLILGVTPRLAWDAWGAAMRDALLARAAGNQPPPMLPGMWGSAMALVCAVALLAGAVFLARRPARRSLVVDQEIPSPGVMAPDGLGFSLRGLAWLGAPSNLFARIWEWLSLLSRGLAWLLSFLEQRYYMAGLMLAVVAIVLLLLQR